MDIKIIIHQHLHWKNLVKSLLNEAEVSILNPSILIKDTDCDLGRWIYSSDKKPFNSNDNFIALKKLHAKFHHLAGTIALNYQSGKVEQTHELMKEFDDISDKLVQQLKQLQQCENIIKSSNHRFNAGIYFFYDFVDNFLVIA